MSDRYLFECKAFAYRIPTVIAAPYVADFAPLQGAHRPHGGFEFYDGRAAESSLWLTLHGMDASREPDHNREIVVAALQEFAERRRKRAALSPLPRVLAWGPLSRNVFWAEVETTDGIRHVVNSTHAFESAYFPPRSVERILDGGQVQPAGFKPW